MKNAKPLIVVVLVIVAGVLLALIVKQNAEPTPPPPEKAPSANPEKGVEKQPDVAKPEVAKPEAAKPEAAKPEVAMPRGVKPELAKPELAKPDVAEPGKGVENMSEQKLAEQKVGEAAKGAPFEWDSDIAAAIRSGDPAQIDRAVQWALGLEGAEQEQALKQITDQLAKLADDDPESAFRLLEGMPPGPARANALRAAVAKIFQTNPDKAIMYAMNLDEVNDGEARNYLIKSLTLSLFPGQLEKAMHMVIQLPPGDEQNTLMNIMGSQMGGQGIDQVEAWLSTLHAPDMREAGLFAAAKALAGNDMKSAEAWISTLTEGGERDAAMAGLAATLASSDLEQAQALLLGLEEGVGKETAMQEVASRLTLNNAETAEQWISALPAGRSRDRAYQGHFTGRCQLDLEFKPDLIGQIQDPEIRLDLERDVAGYLLSSLLSAETADWVRNSSLPEAEKAQWLKAAGL